MIPHRDIFRCSYEELALYEQIKLTDDEWRREYQTPSLVRTADIPKTKGKGSRATGKGAGASKGAGRKSSKVVA